MKKQLQQGILLSLLFLLFYQTNLYSQNNSWDSLPWRDYADYKFQNLNKNLIPKGVLYDRVFPLANVHTYKGSLSFTDTTYTNHFIQSYYEIYQSSYNITGKKKPEDLDSLLNTNYSANEHPIGILFYKFNTIDSLALQDHLLDTLTNGQFVDVSNPSRSPYLTNTSFIGSPLIAEGEYFSTGTHKFYIDPDFFVTNEQVTIKRVEIDFGDGQGWQAMDFTGNLPQRSLGFFSLNILTPFTIFGRIRVILLNVALQELIYGGVFKIQTKAAKTPFIPTACKGQTYWIVDANQAALNQVSATYNNPPIDYKGKKDSAFFFYAVNGSSCGSTVRRPVIIIDGFDPLNKRDMGTIWKENINIRVTRNGDPNTLFGDYMLNEGYDFILLNFKNGNDLIERDALTLVALIERLNQTYGSQYLQDITVMGPSSGGLVVQYALAYMEHNNIAHRVKTFVAFDTQFQGANVPIGLQYFFEYLSSRGILFAINKTRNLLSNGLYNSYVSKQMLAHHHAARSVTPAPHPYRAQFLANLAAVGEYPQLCRKVAIINGVNTGVPDTYITPNTTMLNIAVYRNGIAGICSGNLCKKLDWTCKSTTNSGTNNITQMYTVAPAFNLLLQQPLGYKNWAAGPAWNNSSLDNAPGSTFANIFGNSPDQVNEDKFVFLLRQAMYLITGSQNTTFTQKINRFTMIPSYNAADLRYPSKDLYLNWSNDYLCGKTPLDFVYVPTSNQFHAERNPTNLQYFENEIKCSVSSLPTFIGDLIMPVSVCTTATAFVDQCKTNTAYTYTWTSSNTNVLQIVGTGRQITLNKAGNGTVTVSVNIVGCGLNVTRQKTIKVGLPTTITGINTEQQTIQCNVVAYKYTVIGATGASNFKWYRRTLPGGSFTLFKNSSDNWAVSGGDGTCDQLEIKVLATNSCDLLNGPEFIIESDDCPPFNICLQSTFSGFAVIVSPNPANTNLTLKVDQQTMIQNGYNNPAWMQIKEIKIYDKFGLLKKRIQYSTGINSVSIPVYDLPSDVYSVHITNGVHYVIKQIIIQR
jgi:hypothetical protein